MLFLELNNNFFTVRFSFVRSKVALFVVAALINVVAIGQVPVINTEDLSSFKPEFKPIGKFEVQSGNKLVIRLEAENNKKTDIVYSFSWDFGGEIDQEKDEFRWTPGDSNVGVYPIIFTATDPVSQQSTNQPAIIEINEKQFPPVLKAVHGRTVKNGFISLNELEEFAMLLEAKDGNRDEELQLDYFIEGNSGQKLKNARFEVNGRRATFIWVPDNEQAKKRSFMFTFITTDKTGLSDTKRFSILVNDIKHPPIFQNNNMDYFISEGKPLSFTVKAADLDNDQLYYDVKTDDIKFSDFIFNHQTGKFQWTPDFNYAFNKSKYKLIFSAFDGNTTAYDTVNITVDTKNYPPEVEPIPDKYINENTPLSVKLRIRDLNGNESLRIEALADFEGFNFNAEQRVFTWTPSYKFVSGIDKKTVIVKFIASDGISETSERMKITVYDKEDPKKLLKNYEAVMSLSQGMIGQLEKMNKQLEVRVKKKRFWNTFFDVSTVTLGTFTGISSSSLVKEGFRQTAAPIGSALTTLIGLYAILDKSKDKLPELNWKMVTLQTSLDRTTSKMVRKYGENPSSQTIENKEFKTDLNDFEKIVTECEIEKDKLLIEIAKLNSN